MGRMKELGMEEQEKAYRNPEYQKRLDDEHQYKQYHKEQAIKRGDLNNKLLSTEPVMLQDIITVLESEYITAMQYEQCIARLKKIKDQSIRWTVEDFAHQANQITDNRAEEAFDKNKYQEALEMMISKHDASIGITWETINVYLEEYCRI